MDDPRSCSYLSAASVSQESRRRVTTHSKDDYGSDCPHPHHSEEDIAGQPRCTKVASKEAFHEENNRKLAKSERDDEKTVTGKDGL